MPLSADHKSAFRVLAVDDEAPIRALVARILCQPGYDVRVAADGLEALQLAETDGPYDLLVTDLLMPKLRGDELARRLRRASPSLKVLYLTGYSDQLFEARSLLWEDEAFLEKPVSVQGLLEAASLLLEGRVPPPRAPRVSLPGARARFGDHVAVLESVSVTGGKVQLRGTVPVGSTWPVLLDLPSDTVRVTARVVSCTPFDIAASPPVAESPSSYVAFAFENLAHKTRLILERVIRERQETESRNEFSRAPRGRDGAGARSEGPG